MCMQLFFTSICTGLEFACTCKLHPVQISWKHVPCFEWYYWLSLLHTLQCPFNNIWRGPYLKVSLQTVEMWGKQVQILGPRGGEGSTLGFIQVRKKAAHQDMGSIGIPTWLPLFPAPFSHPPSQSILLLPSPIPVHVPPTSSCSPACSMDTSWLQRVWVEAWGGDMRHVTAVTGAGLLFAKAPPYVVWLEPCQPETPMTMLHKRSLKKQQACTCCLQGHYHHMSPPSGVLCIHEASMLHPSERDESVAVVAQLVTSHGSNGRGGKNSRSKRMGKERQKKGGSIMAMVSPSTLSPTLCAPHQV